LKVELTIDDEANAAYMKVRSGKVASTESHGKGELSYLVDYDSKGRLLGIEILNAKAALTQDRSDRSLIPKKPPNFIMDSSRNYLERTAMIEQFMVQALVVSQIFVDTWEKPKLVQ
jgi:uncharacterized protein YuzE